ncbi:phage tail protein [Silvimonas sp.]|uniref:phage tail protein n=1 Tax=Silvimonas sp. TaxID=2650811 RepID=UPI0028482411|nr:phage tail protein [Silvimonas sp.]MDR3429023.1 phage tail protein [Silvimonas sp.]
MIKPASLRTTIFEALPTLGRDPDKFLCFIDSGQLLATGVPASSWEYRYQLNLILTDFAGKPDALFLPIVRWLHIHQPELLANDQLREHAIAFEVDILDDERVDIAVRIPLRESVIASADGGGQLVHPPEPMPAASDWSSVGL